MPPLVIDVRHADDTRDIVHRAVQSLAEGGLVVFPTETVYGVAASALNAQAVETLSRIKSRSPDRPFALAVKSSDDALDYVPDISSLGRRLARRCWPGPITLVLQDCHPESLAMRLPELVRGAVTPTGKIGLRVPAHDLILSVLRLTSGPLVLTSANRAGEEDAVTAQQVVQSLGDEVALVLDDGRSRFAQPSSVVAVEENCWRILRPGVLTEARMKWFANLLVLFVCTGNTCRSPMAEAMFRERLAKRLGCPPNGLEENGVMVMSAGIAAMAGGRSTSEAVSAMSERRIDLTAHESQPLTPQLVRFADLIVTMTRGHREAIVAQWPEAAERTHLLCRESSDVADPIGGPFEAYVRCANQIDTHLADWLERIDASTLPKPGESGA